MLYLLFIISGGSLLFESLVFLLPLLHQEPQPRKKPYLSILIPAHNEKEELQKNLPQITASMNEGDELLVVDDGSTDGSFEFLMEMSAEMPLVVIRNYTRQGKKRAVDIACKKATHATILQTDADCRPRSKEWTDRMRAASAEGGELVLGWGSIEGDEGMLSSLLRYETARKALRYSVAAMLGMPYMGVGRNLLYQRQLRTKQKMPKDYYKTMSGDDDLFIGQVGSKVRTKVISHPAAHTVSPPPSSWNEHWNRSRRQAEAGLHYTWPTVLALGSSDLAESIFFISSIVLLSKDQASFILMGFLGILLFRGIVMNLVTKSLIPGYISLLTPILAFISLMNRIFVEGSVLVSKPTRWQ